MMEFKYSNGEIVVEERISSTDILDKFNRKAHRNNKSCDPGKGKKDRTSSGKEDISGYKDRGE